jgi:hypothetical protein
MARRFVPWVILLVLVGAASDARAITFAFAGETWEQDSTPDVLGLLGSGANLGGAVMSTGFPTHITQSVGFIATGGNASSGFTGAPGYDPNLSLGKQATAQHGLLQTDNTASVFTSAVNLPAGNLGASTRHGLRVSWSAGRTLANAPGADFVVYESGSNSTSPEGFMVRAQLTGGSYTDWYYRIFSAFQLYTNTPAVVEGAFAHVFDLSALGLADGDAIQAIEIANLNSADRIDVVGSFATEGVVVFGDVSGTLARPATNGNNNATYGSGALDPDPLYVGIFNALDEPAAVPVESTQSLVWIAAGLLAALALAVATRRRPARA